MGIKNLTRGICSTSRPNTESIAHDGSSWRIPLDYEPARARYRKKPLSHIPTGSQRYGTNDDLLKPIPDVFPLALGMNLLYGAPGDLGRRCRVHDGAFARICFFDHEILPCLVVSLTRGFVLGHVVIICWVFPLGFGYILLIEVIEHAQSSAHWRPLVSAPSS